MTADEQADVPRGKLNLQALRTRADLVRRHIQLCHVTTADLLDPDWRQHPLITHPILHRAER